MNYPEWLAEQEDARRNAPRVLDPLGEVLVKEDRLQRRGLWLEFGVYEGRTLRVLAEARGEAHVFGFDSFEGLPEDWREGHPAGEFALATPPSVEGASIVRGLFEDTLPRFPFFEPVTLVHVDCDLYSSTRCALRHVRPHLAPGAVLVFDELLDYPGHEEHELRALYESTREGLRFEWLALAVAGEKAAILVH
jgi:SAM-dependent methyltransferase